MFKGVIIVGTFALGVALGYGIRGATEANPRALVSVESGHLPASNSSFGGVSSERSAVKWWSPSESMTPRDDRVIVQQRTGTICETPVGTCTVRPQPINSPCRCGNNVGQIVR